MPERETIKRARKDARQGKSASTQAGEFVREEMHHIREGKHGAVDEAGNRDWVVKGAPRRCKVGRKEGHVGADAGSGEARPREGTSSGAQGGSHAEASIGGLVLPQ